MRNKGLGIGVELFHISMVDYLARYCERKVEMLNQSEELDLKPSYER